jgi:hypothetical protein
MVCYYHPGRTAVGLCRHCQRGLCTGCAALVEDVLACVERHESQVAAANQATWRTNTQAQRIGSGYVRNGVFYGLVGAAFAGLGLIQYRFLGLQALFFIFIGVFLIYAAAANLLESRNYR